MTWQAAANAYHAHHFGCPVCMGAGRQPGVLPRCGDGAQLWQAYQDHPLPAVLSGPVRPGVWVLGAKTGVNQPLPPRSFNNYR
jgi:hypothetical protein